MESDRNMRARKKVAVTQASNDGRLFAAHTSPDTKKTADYKPGYTDSTVIPHDRVSTVDTSIFLEKLTCPRCGKPTLHAEFPDHYECWIKCSSCGFFMGMSNEEWHRMENSPNLNGKIKKMAIEKELVKVQI
jgi:ribosomal protein S27AE